MAMTDPTEWYREHAEAYGKNAALCATWVYPDGPYRDELNKQAYEHARLAAHFARYVIDSNERVAWEQARFPHEAKVSEPFLQGRDTGDEA